MASKLSPATPRPKVQRGSGLADGERMSPATKTGAANMLGDNSPKATRSPRSFSTEKKTPVSRGAELQQVQEELAKTKEQLALMEKSKSNLLQDLARSKRQLEDLNSKLQDANEDSKKDRLRAEEMEHASFTAAEDWQAELEIMKKQYEAAILDLQTNKQATENLKHELFVCIEAKDEAVRLAGEAMNAAESTAKRVEEMSAELLATKGSSVVADSASARVDELMVDLSSAQEGLAEITATCDKSTKDAAALITGEEAELQNSLLEISHLRSEAETLKQELALAQDMIQQQTTYDKSIKETTALLNEKEAELQNALQEVSHLRSVTVSLKQELSAAQESVMQQTVYEKNAKVEAAALLANKDVELQDAIQEAGLLRSEFEGLKQELALAQKSVVQQAGGPDALELYQTQLAAAKKAERTSEARHLNAMSEVDRLSSELKCAQIAENKSSMLLANAMSELEQLQNELAAASEAKEKALVAENVASAHFRRMNAEIANAKESESVALASLSVISAELMEAQDKLAKAVMEGSVLVGFLESLKTDFERIQLDLANMVGEGVQANERIEFLSLELTKMRETSQRESKLLNGQVAKAQAAVESLKVDAERQRLDMFDVVKKEALSNEKVIHVTRSLQNAENELAELKRQLLTASDKNDVFAKQLDVSVKEISEMKERELSMSTRVASLIQALEDKEYEVVEWERRVGISDSTSTALALDLKNTKAELVEWERRVGISDSTSTALALDLQNTKAELLELKERESCVSTKATALSVVLASLTEKNEAKLNELQEREAAVNAKVAVLNTEIKKTKLDFEEALTAGKVAKNEAEKLQVSLELATLELDHSRQERQKISAEAARNKEGAHAALVESQESKAEAEKAREAAHLAESEVQKQSQEIKSMMLNLQMVQDESNLAKVEVESLSDKLGVATAELQASREEMEQLRHEAQASKRDSELLQSSISMEKEQAILVAQAAREEVERIQKEMDTIKLNEERALALSKTSEDRLQDALKELQTFKSNATCVQEEASPQTDSLENENNCSTPQEELENLRVKVQQTEEHLALALKEIENSSENENNCSTPQEELENLRVKVQQTEEHLALALKEIENSYANTQNLLRNLENMKLEKEANEKAFLEVHQHLADTEKAKSNLEAEIQRLLDESKQWHTVKDAIDIPIHSEVLGRNFSSDCRDEKPQPDSPNAASEIPVSPSHENVKGEEELVERQERVMKEHMAMGEDLFRLSLRREDVSEKEESSLRDEAALHDELLSVPTKKKKKTLFVRLGTLLEKKKHASQHAP